MRIILVAYQARAWYVVENGVRTRLWEIAELKEAFDVTEAETAITDYCCWGLDSVNGPRSPWQKTTRLTGTLPGLPSLGRRCGGQRHCPRLGKNHVALAGRDATGTLRTTLAEPCPVELCAAVADLAAAHAARPAR